MYATEIYEQLIIVTNTIIGSIANLKDIDGNLLSAQSSVSVPATVNQSGILYGSDFTSYSFMFHRWQRGGPQLKLSRIWEDQGFPCDRGIALIGGYYCVAVKPKFGTTGDVIVITLEDGTQFAAIVCDEKGDDAKSDWGHPKYEGGKSLGISIIEWQRVKTENGKVVTSGVSDTDVDSLYSTEPIKDWYKKKVLCITNYGKYTDVKWT